MDGAAKADLQKSQRLRRNALLDEGAGNRRRAFDTFLEAWKIARAHPEAPGASDLVELLKGDLNRLRDQLNDTAKTPAPNKTIRIK
jgi:hypothetical protein